MGLLDGGGSAFLAGVFSRIYLDGEVIAVTSEYDEIGEITSIETSVPARVQVDAMTESMRGQDGAAEGDRRIIVLAPVEVTTDSVIAVNAGPYAGSNWLIMSTERDPCGSYTNCRARRRPS